MGEITPSRVCSPRSVLGPIVATMISDLADYSAERITRLITRFTTFVEYEQVCSLGDITATHVSEFVRAPLGNALERRLPSTATMHLRRSALRLYFQAARRLGLLEGDPTLDLTLPPRSSTPTRPLQDDEVMLCRSSSLHSLSATRRSASWALAEATARTSEVPHIRVCDVDLGRARVWLHGGNKAQPRWGYLTAWGLRQVERRLRSCSRPASSNSLLVYGGRGALHSRQAASCIAIKEVLVRAGLGQEPDVRPGSVVAWAGRRIFKESDCIAEVARRLGMRSLDGAARMIAWEWASESSGSER